MVVGRGGSTNGGSITHLNCGALELKSVKCEVSCLLLVVSVFAVCVCVCVCRLWIVSPRLGVKFPLSDDDDENDEREKRNSTKVSYN